MSKSLDELYFTWLYHHVAEDSRNPSETYWKLLRQLYCKEFVWIIPNDDNRAEDGKDLRLEFVESEGIDVDHEWMNMTCSMLELLIGLSRRLSFEAEGEPRGWFWHMIENLGFEIYNDNSLYPEGEIDRRLDELIWRLYKRNGSGGLFPLKRPPEDQRNVEIWYQLSAYLLEIDNQI